MRSARKSAASSAQGKASHTPVMPSHAPSAATAGRGAAQPRSRERAKPSRSRPPALKKAASTMFTPAKRKPEK